MTTTTAYAQGSRKQIVFCAETAYGVTPTTPVMKFLRFTGENFELARTTNESNEVNPGRQLMDLRLGQNSVNADFDFEYSYGSFDEILEAALGGIWSAEAAGTPNTLKMGNVQRSFSFEVGHPDIGKYRLYKGMVVDKVTLNIKQGGAIITGKCSMLGATMVSSGTPADALPDTITGTGSPMDSGVSLSLKEGGSTIAIVTTLDLTIANNLKSDSAAGSLSVTGIGYGKARVTGTLTAYFKDAALLDKFLNETVSSLEITMAGLPADKTLTVDIPQLKYTGSKVDAAVEGSLGISLPFSGIYDVVTGTTIKFTRSNP